MAEVKEIARTKTDGLHTPAKATAGLAEREVRRAERLARRASSLALRAGSPFAFIRRFAEEMDRLFEDFGLERGLGVPGMLGRRYEVMRREAELGQAEWSPVVDIIDRDGTLTIRADLPGLSKDDIHVDVTEDAITIQGERTEEKKEEREGHCYRERSYGRFYRAIPLPEGVDSSKATAEFHNGVLAVALPAPSHSQRKARRLEILEKK